MLAMSAADAISPAIQRTRSFLFRPFRLETYLKLCLVALVTEGIGGNFHFSVPGGHSSNQQFNFYPAGTLTAGRITALVAFAVVATVLGCVLYYLITRLRFAYFHCLIHNTKEIRPGWRLYRAQATRFFWLNLVVGLCYLLAVALIALPFVAGFWKLARDTPAGGHADMGSVLALALPLIPLIALVVLTAFSIDVTLRDLMLPHFALENATAGEAWSAAWSHIKAEKGSFFVYALLRLVLPIAAMIGLFIVLIIPGFLFVSTVVMFEAGIHAAFSGAVVGIFLAVLTGLVAFGIALLVAIGVAGPLSTAVREYALLFYGGRYQRLGDILSPPPLSA